MPDRKVIHIDTVIVKTRDAFGNKVLLVHRTVLCDDGTMWQTEDDGRTWTEIGPVPQRVNITIPMTAGEPLKDGDIVFAAPRVP